MARKWWTEAEIEGMQRDLRTMNTKEVASRYGTNRKALCAALCRRGIHVQWRYPKKRKVCSGVSIRRPTIGAPARYGAEALVKRAERSCSWPLGDPSDPQFAFCGATADGRSP